MIDADAIWAKRNAVKADAYAAPARPMPGKRTLDEHGIYNRWNACGRAAMQAAFAEAPGSDQ